MLLDALRKNVDVFSDVLCGVILDDFLQCALVEIAVRRQIGRASILCYSVEAFEEILPYSEKLVWQMFRTEHTNGDLSKRSAEYNFDICGKILVINALSPMSGSIQ